jgi:hypothetical protein
MRTDVIEVVRYIPENSNLLLYADSGSGDV